AFTVGAPPADDITLVAIKEKSGAAEIGGEVLARLTDAIDNKKMPVAEACRRFQISPSTYYRLKHGASHAPQPQQLSVEKSAALRRLALAHPELDAIDLTALLRSDAWGGFDLTPTRVHAELRRLGLARSGSRRSAVSQTPGLASATAAAPAAATVETPPPAAEPLDELFVEQGGLRALVERAPAP